MEGIVTNKITFERTEEKVAKGGGGKYGKSPNNKISIQLSESTYKILH